MSAATHEELLAELDAMLAEAPPNADDLAAELTALVAGNRNHRCTERPGAYEEG